RPWTYAGVAALGLALSGCDSNPARSADAAREPLGGDRLTEPSRGGEGGASSPARDVPASAEAPASPAGLDAPAPGDGAGSGAAPDVSASAGASAPPDAAPPGPSELQLVEATVAELRAALATRLVTP